MDDPRKNPMDASWNVNQAFLRRKTLSGRVERPSRMSENNSPTMSAAGGMMMSSVETGNSMPVPGQRLSVCRPIHL